MFFDGAVTAAAFNVLMFTNLTDILDVCDGIAQGAADTLIVHWSGGIDDGDQLRLNPSPAGVTSPTTVTMTA